MCSILSFVKYENDCICTIESFVFQFHCAQMTPIVLASSCEALWCSSCAVSHKPHLSHALWLHCGVHGTRAWLPLFPNSADKSHIFLARRIMLPFTPSIYPLGERSSLCILSYSYFQLRFFSIL